MNDLKKSQVRALFETAELPSLGPERRASARPLDIVRREVEEAVEAGGVAGERESLITGLALLWHDYLDEAHAIAQEIHSGSGSLLHGIMHRREPDYGNAGYWFRRAGDHPSFEALAVRVSGWSAEHPLARTLTRGGRWHPFEFIEACERASGRAGAAGDRDFLRRVQRAESECFLEWLLAPAGS